MWLFHHSNLSLIYSKIFERSLEISILANIFISFGIFKTLTFNLLDLILILVESWKYLKIHQKFSLQEPCACLAVISLIFWDFTDFWDKWLIKFALGQHIYFCCEFVIWPSFDLTLHVAWGYLVLIICLNIKQNQSALTVLVINANEIQIQRNCYFYIVLFLEDLQIALDNRLIVMNPKTQHQIL